jgi:tetratricopeptide (TPR) repeat protein
VRSSERLRSIGALVGRLALMTAAAFGVRATRGDLATAFHQLRVTEDVFPLPPPDYVVLGSLGYRAALADLVYGHMLVSYGLHFQEKRRFEFVGQYLDTINALDPSFAQPYRFADTLLVMSPEAPRQEDYVKAKEILERGLAQLPYDTNLWLTAGQYMAYLAFPHLEDRELAREWRRRGAEVLARACELVSDNENIPYHCITAAGIFDRVGEREAAIESLQRLIAVNDDPGIEAQATSFLRRYLGERAEEEAASRKRVFEGAWRDTWPFVSKELALLLGPPVELPRCAGPGNFGERGCEVNWAAWGRAVTLAGEAG